MLSQATNTLYRLNDSEGNLLKRGISNDPAGRYSQAFMADKSMVEIASGSRADMATMERIPHRARWRSAEPGAVGGERVWQQHGVDPADPRRWWMMPDPEFEPPERPDLLSIGFNVGGSTPANELLSESFRAVMKAVMQRRTEYPNDGLRINVVFQIPGRLSQPDFEGVFPARYARKTNHLLVNAAVPASLTYDHVREYFVQALKETKAATLDYLRTRKINVDTTNVMSLIDDLASERAAS